MGNTTTAAPADETLEVLNFDITDETSVAAPTFACNNGEPLVDGGVGGKYSDDKKAMAVATSENEEENVALDDDVIEDQVEEESASKAKKNVNLTKGFHFAKKRLSRPLHKKQTSSVDVKGMKAPLVDDNEVCADQDMLDDQVGSLLTE